MKIKAWSSFSGIFNHNYITYNLTENFVIKPLCQCIGVYINNSFFVLFCFFIDNPNSFARRQNDDIYVVKLNVHVCL